MKEVLSKFSSFAKERKKARELYDFARLSKKKYFAGELRQEKLEGDPFDISESVPKGILETVEESLNKTLEIGGSIAIVDLIQEDVIRVHTLRKKHYARFVLGADPNQHRLEEKRTGDFVVSLRGSVIPGSSSLFLDIVGNKPSGDISGVSWIEYEDPNRRFAVLTYQKNIWGVVLDSRVNPDEGVPTWKVNTQVYAH